ncbi:MAG: Ku domain protein [Bryobacterales bacterium]|nr:Ku domain protein [Bryobacterales bacterium]
MSEPSSTAVELHLAFLMAATVWKGHLSFGLVSIPVRLNKAARAEKIKFRQLRRSAPAVEQTEPVLSSPGPTPIRSRRHEDFVPAPTVPDELPEGWRDTVVQPVRHAATTGDDALPIPQAEIVRGYEYEPDRYVLVDENELKSITPKTSRDIQILEFVQFGEIDPVYLETSYYMAPEPEGEKPYALLYEALRRTGYSAIAQIAMHRREHVAIIRPGIRGIVMHTMFYTNEVRRDQEFLADPELVAQKELELAIKLVEALSGKFEPEKYSDRFHEHVQTLIAAKVRGREVVSSEARPAEAAAVINIMDALRKSLEAARKPVAKAEESVPQAKTGHKRAAQKRVQGKRR